MMSSYPHLRSNRSSSWCGRKRTSASSTTWFCRPSSPGGPCTSSPWGWRRGRCPRCGRTTPRGPAGQTPPCGWAGSASSDGPVEKKLRDASTQLTESRGEKQRGNSWEALNVSVRRLTGLMGRRTGGVHTWWIEDIGLLAYTTGS